MMNKNKFLLIAMLVGVSLSATSQTYSGGSGSETDPFLISTISDLDELNDMTNNGLTEYTYFLLTNDITTPYKGMIGTEGVFHGTFDGGGHCITLDIDRNESYVGLFGTTTRATIRNLQVDGSVFAVHYVGAIVGNPSNGTLIENCINYANVSGSTRVGGIVGGIVTTKQYGNEGVTVRNCANCGTVSGVDIVGGVVGYSGQQIGNMLCRLVNYGHIDAPERVGDERLGGVVGNPLYDDNVSALVNFGTISNRTISGTMGNSNPETQKELFYDGQMSPTYYAYPYQEKLTRDIIGYGLENKSEGSDMSSLYWLYEDGMLPRLKMNGMEQTARAILYATPVILDDDSQADDVKNNFVVGTNHGVQWSSSQQNVVFSSEGNATVVSNGEDALVAQLDGYTRTITINIDADLTKINKPLCQTSEKSMFDIGGRKISKEPMRGIYISRGKKILK